MTVNLSITKCTVQELTRSKTVQPSKESSMKIGRSVMDFIDSIAIGKNVRVNREKEKTGYTIHKIR